MNSVRLCANCACMYVPAVRVRAQGVRVLCLNGFPKRQDVRLARNSVALKEANRSRKTIEAPLAI
eukprot:8267714-Heterocapsa_arctica.AAC.1